MTPVWFGPAMFLIGFAGGLAAGIAGAVLWRVRKL